MVRLLRAGEFVHGIRVQIKINSSELDKCLGFLCVNFPFFGNALILYIRRIYYNIRATRIKYKECSKLQKKCNYFGCNNRFLI